MKKKRAVNRFLASILSLCMCLTMLSGSTLTTFAQIGDGSISENSIVLQPELEESQSDSAVSETEVPSESTGINESSESEVSESEEDTFEGSETAETEPEETVTEETESTETESVETAEISVNEYMESGDEGPLTSSGQVLAEYDYDASDNCFFIFLSCDYSSFSDEYDADDATADIRKILESCADYDKYKGVSGIEITYSGRDSYTLHKDIVNAIVDNGLLNEEGILQIRDDLTDSDGQLWQFSSLESSAADISLEIASSTTFDNTGAITSAEFTTGSSTAYPGNIDYYAFNTGASGKEADVPYDTGDWYVRNDIYGYLNRSSHLSGSIDLLKNYFYVYVYCGNLDPDTTYVTVNGRLARLMLDYDVNGGENQEGGHRETYEYQSMTSLVNHAQALYEEDESLFTNTGYFDVDLSSESCIPADLFAFCQNNSLKMNCNYDMASSEFSEEESWVNFNFWIDTPIGNTSFSDVSLTDLSVQKAEPVPAELTGADSAAKAVVISGIPAFPDCQWYQVSVTAENLLTDVCTANKDTYIWYDNGDDSLIYVGAANHWTNDDSSQGVCLRLGDLGNGTYYLSNAKGNFYGKEEDWGYEDEESGDWIASPALIFDEVEAGYSLSSDNFKDLFTALDYWKTQTDDEGNAKKFQNIEFCFNTKYGEIPEISGKLINSAKELLITDHDEYNVPCISFAYNDEDEYTSINLNGIHDGIDNSATWKITAATSYSKGIASVTLPDTDYPADHVGIHLNRMRASFEFLGDTGNEEISVAVTNQKDSKRKFLTEGNYRTDDERVYVNIDDVNSLPVNTVLQLSPLDYLEVNIADDTVTMSSLTAVPSKASWYSSDPLIASISSKGVLTLIDTGETIISAAAGKDTVLYKVNVCHSPITGIALNRNLIELQMDQGEYVAVWNEDGYNEENVEADLRYFGLYPEFIPTNFAWNFDEDGDPYHLFTYSSSNEDVVRVSRSYEREDEESELRLGDDETLFYRNWKTDEEGNRIPIRDCEIEIIGPGTATITAVFDYTAADGTYYHFEDTCIVVVKDRTANIALPENTYYIIGAEQVVGDIQINQPEGGYYEWKSPKQKLTTTSPGVISIPATYIEGSTGIKYDIEIPVAAVKLNTPEIYYEPGDASYNNPFETGLIYEYDSDKEYQFNIYSDSFSLLKNAWLFEHWVGETQVIDLDTLTEKIKSNFNFRINWSASKNLYDNKTYTVYFGTPYFLVLPEKAFSGNIKLTASYSYQCMVNGKYKAVKLDTGTANIKVSKKAPVNFQSKIDLSENSSIVNTIFPDAPESIYLDINQAKNGVLTYFFLANSDIFEPANAPSGTKITVKSSDASVLSVGKVKTVDAVEYDIKKYVADITLKKTGPVTITLTANDEQKTTLTYKIYVTDYKTKLSTSSLTVNRNYNAENGAFNEDAFGSKDSTSTTMVTVSVPNGLDLVEEEELPAIDLVSDEDPDTASDNDNDKFNLYYWTDEIGTRFYLTAKDKNLATGTYKVTVGINAKRTAEEDAAVETQCFPLNVKVTSSMPKFSAKQTATVNSFYASDHDSSWGTIKITASSFRNNVNIATYTIDGETDEFGNSLNYYDMWLEPAAADGTCHYEIVSRTDFSYQDSSYFSTTTSVPVKLIEDYPLFSIPAKEKLNLVIHCKGYENIKIPVTIQAKKTPYKVTTNLSKLTIYPETGNTNAVLKLLTPEKNIFDIRPDDPKTTAFDGTTIRYISSSKQIYKINPYEDTLYDELDSVEFVLDDGQSTNKKVASKITFTVQQPEWREAVILTATVTNDPTVKPALTLSSSTLTLNKNEAFESQQVYSYLRQKGCSEPLSAEYEVRITGADAKSRKVLRTGMDVYYDFNYEEDWGFGSIVANVIDPNKLPTGTYKFTITQLKDGTALAKTTQTIKVVDQAPEKAFKTKQSGTLNLADIYNSELIVTPSLGSIQGEIYNVTFDSSYLDGWYDGETGKLHLSLNPYSLLPASGKYTVPLQIEFGSYCSYSNVRYDLTIEIKSGSFATYLKKLPSMLWYDHFYNGVLYTGYKGMTCIDLPTYSTKLTEFYPVSIEPLNYTDSFNLHYDQANASMRLSLSDNPVKTGNYKLKFKISYWAYTSYWNEESGQFELEFYGQPVEKTITYTVKVK